MLLLRIDFSNKANKKVCMVSEIPDNWQGLDAGPETLKAFEQVVMKSKTILWNGPLGVFEFENFSIGTMTLGEQIGKSTSEWSLFACRWRRLSGCSETV